MGALKPRARLYVLFACVQAVMLGSWLLASFAQAKGELIDRPLCCFDSLLLFITSNLLWLLLFATLRL
jgi:hypothetical protein